MAVGDRTQLAGTAYDRLRILTTCRNIAMVGLSSNPYAPSSFAGSVLYRPLALTHRRRGPRLDIRRNHSDMRGNDP